MDKDEAFPSVGRCKPAELLLVFRDTAARERCKEPYVHASQRPTAGSFHLRSFVRLRISPANSRSAYASLTPAHGSRSRLPGLSAPSSPLSQFTISRTSLSSTPAP